MNLSISDPNQPALPGSVITYHYTLENTIATDLPIASFVGLNLPAYLTELFVPFTVPANGTITGSLSFQVANSASPGAQTFAIEAASSLHEPSSGLSYVSNMAAASVDVVAEPSAVILAMIGLGVLLTLGRTNHRSCS